MTVLFSLIRTIFYVVSFKLRFPEKYYNKNVLMEDGLEFKIFRHMKLKQKKNANVGSIFIVRFKFNKYDHTKNIKLSKIPIPLIAGFSGFRDKLWMIDWKTGYWQGLYQWESIEAIEKYKKSFVLGIMNKRSNKDTLSYKSISDLNIEDYLKKVVVN